MGYKRSRLSKPQIEKRRSDAIGLLAAGYTYQRIADSMGYSSRAAAYKDIKAALLQQQHHAVDELRSLELERLDVATRAIFKDVAKGDHKAIDSLLKIMARRARYVPQLEVPQEHELAAGSGTVTVVFDQSLGDKHAPDPTPGE